MIKKEGDASNDTPHSYGNVLIISSILPRVDHKTTRTMSRVLERLTRRMGERRRRRCRRRAATFHRVSSRIVAQRLESFWTMDRRPACAFPSRPMQQEHHASKRSSNGLANHWPDHESNEWDSVSGVCVMNNTRNARRKLFRELNQLWLICARWQV